MASQSTTRTGMTLEEFLAWPRIDEKPYLEYSDGRIEVKVSPQSLHCMLENEIASALNRAALPGKFGRAFPELRCTFGGRSIVPDVVFLLEGHLKLDARRRPVNEVFTPPDIHIEIRSPGQSLRKTREKIEHSFRNGCLLGWFLDPDRETVDVYRPGRPPERLPADGFLDAAPVLPTFRIAVSEVFGWLVHGGPDEVAEGGQPT